MMPVGATRREWIGLAVIALPCLFYAMDLTVLNLALPAISKALKPSGTQLLWIVDIYGFVVAGSLITMGTLGDHIGRRKLLMIGAAAFAATSILAAISKSAEMLIVTRALLGFAGATVAPSTLSLIRTMFQDPRERTKAIGWWITSYSVGGAIGPLLGGLLLAHFRWGSVFLLSVPVMVLLLLVGPFLLPEYRDPNAGRLDLLSVAFSLVGVLGVIYGVKYFAEKGTGWPVWTAVSVGVLSSLLFVHRQRRLPHPLVDLKLFAIPGFTVALLIYMVASMVIFGCFIFISQYLQLVMGLSPLRAGFWTLPSMIGFIVGAQLCTLLVRWVRPVILMVTGMGVAVIGFALLTPIGRGLGPMGILFAVGIYSLGLAPSFTLATDLIVGAAPPEHAGSASAISETSSELGGALGIAIFGSVGLAIYRHAMAIESLSSLTPAMARAARDTLGGATAVAAHLPPALHESLLQTAHAAFTHGLERAAWISIVLTLTTAVLAAVFLRPAKKSPQLCSLRPIASAAKI